MIVCIILIIIGVGIPYLTFKIDIEPKLKKELERAKNEKEEYLKGYFEHNQRIARLEAWNTEVDTSYSELNKRVSEKIIADNEEFMEIDERIISLEKKIEAQKNQLDELKPKNNDN